MGDDRSGKEQREVVLEQNMSKEEPFKPLGENILEGTTDVLKERMCLMSLRSYKEVSVDGAE